MGRVARAGRAGRVGRGRADDAGADRPDATVLPRLERSRGHAPVRRVRPGGEGGRAAARQPPEVRAGAARRHREAAGRHPPVHRVRRRHRWSRGVAQEDGAGGPGGVGAPVERDDRRRRRRAGVGRAGGPGSSGQRGNRDRPAVARAGASRRGARGSPAHPPRGLVHLLRRLRPGVQLVGRADLHGRGQGARRAGSLAAEARGERRAPGDARYDDGGAGRPRGARGRAAARDDPVHAGGTGRHRAEGVRLVRPRDAAGLARHGVRRRLARGAREGEGDARRAGRSAGRDPAPRARGDLVRRAARPGDAAAARDGDLADADAERRAPAGEPVLPRRGDDVRVVPDRHDDVRAEDDEHAGEQHPVLARDRVPRGVPRPPAPGLHDRALPGLSRSVRHPFLDRGERALVGDALLGPRLSEDAGGARGDAVLADAPVRAHHLLAGLPPRHDDAAAGGGLPGGPGGPRAPQRGGRGPAVVRRLLPAPLPVRLHGRARCSSASCTASWSGRRR